MNGLHKHTSRTAAADPVVGGTVVVVGGTVVVVGGTVVVVGGTVVVVGGTVVVVGGTVVVVGGTVVVVGGTVVVVGGTVVVVVVVVVGGVATGTWRFSVNDADDSADNHSLPVRPLTVTLAPLPSDARTRRVLDEELAYSVAAPDVIVICAPFARAAGAKIAADAVQPPARVTGDSVLGHAIAALVRKNGRQKHDWLVDCELSPTAGDKSAGANCFTVGEPAATGCAIPAMNAPRDTTKIRTRAVIP